MKTIGSVTYGKSESGFESNQVVHLYGIEGQIHSASDKINTRNK